MILAFHVGFTAVSWWCLAETWAGLKGKMFLLIGIQNMNVRGQLEG